MKYILVQIIGDHPHAGEFGRLKIEKDDTVDVVMCVSVPMVRIELSDDGDGCYAKASNIRKLSGIRTTI